MSMLFFAETGTFPALDTDTLRRFLDELEAVAPGTRWTAAILTHRGRLYFFRDHPEHPGDDLERRCRAYLDLTEGGSFHVSAEPATPEGDLRVRRASWYLEYQRSTGSLQPVRGPHEPARSDA